MARQRRTGGFKAPELKGTLGTLLRTTLQQANVVRDVLERGAREGRARFDDARQSRRRQDTLAELGEIVLDLIRRGEIDPEELPEIREVVHHLDDIDAGAPAHAHPRDSELDDDVAMPPTRRRFDDRPGSATIPGTPRRTRDDDGTVASSAKPAPRVWRPPADDAGPRPEAATVAPPFRSKAMPATPARKGGISFDEDDDDLAEYMHPDDVAPKPSDS